VESVDTAKDGPKKFGRIFNRVAIIRKWYCISINGLAAIDHTNGKKIFCARPVYLKNQHI
jgi:hypothetical protein